MLQYSKLIILFSDAVVFATAGYAAACHRSLGKELKTFSWFLYFSGVIQFVSMILWFMKRNNLPLLHVYVAGGFFLLALFYRSVLRGFINEIIISGIAIGFLIFTTLNSLFVQDIFTYNSNALVVEAIIVIILSLTTYTVLLNDIVRETRPKLTNGLNWINSGLFVYYSSSLLIFYFGDIITRLSASFQVRNTWILHAFFSVVMYSCFFVGLWKRPRM